MAELFTVLFFLTNIKNFVIKYIHSVQIKRFYEIKIIKSIKTKKVKRVT